MMFGMHNLGEMSLLCKRRVARVLRGHGLWICSAWCFLAFWGSGMKRWLALGVCALSLLGIEVARAETIPATITAATYRSGLRPSGPYFNSPHDHAVLIAHLAYHYWNAYPNAVFEVNTTQAPGNCQSVALSAITESSPCNLYYRYKTNPSAAWGTVAGTQVGRVSVSGYTCPVNQNWTLSGSTCSRPDCVTGQTRDSGGVCRCPAGEEVVGGACTAVCPENATRDGSGSCVCNAGHARSSEGECIGAAEGKGQGDAPGELCVGNPVNAGTGGKAHTETVYRGGSGTDLGYRIHHGSRRSGDRHQLVAGHGRYWIHDYERRLNPGTGVTTGGPGNVGALRPDGKLISYSRQANGSYLPDADIDDRLYRLADGSGATTGWQLHTAGNAIETYDPTGKLIRIDTPQGRMQILAYDANGRLSQIADSTGRTLVLAYDAQNRVTTLTQPDGGLVLFSYDTANNLATITWPDGRTRSYHYENPGFPSNLTGITDENGNRFATYGYDSEGRGNLTEHAGGAQRTTLAFGGSSTAVTDALGTVRTHTLTTVLGVVRGGGQSQPGGSGCGASASAQTYDANGNVATRTDFNGTLTTYTYDLSRNLETSRVEGSGSAVARTIGTQWHGVWRLPVKVARPLKLTTWVYNGDTYGGQTVTCAPADAVVPSPSGTGTRPIAVLCRQIEQATTDATGSQGFGATASGEARIWNWTYDPHGQVLTADGPRTDVADITTYSYYPADDTDTGRRGRVATVTNALGHATQISAYDANGRPLTVVDPNGVVTTLTYDARGRLVSQAIDGEVTGYQYDGVGQLIRLTLPDGAWIAYSYDAAHRLTGLDDALGNRVRYTLDALGNRLREDVTDPANQLSRTHRRAYDALNRLYRDIGAQDQITEYGYDANGNLTSITDPLNRIATRGYDALDRLIRNTDPAGGQTRMAYDGQDRLIQVTDPRNLVTGYTIDGLGNLTRLASPDTGTATQAFDAAGNRTGRTDARGQAAVTQYDALNRPTQVTYGDGRQEIYTWDLGTNGIGRLGHLQEIEDGNVTATTSYGYDTSGRVLSETRTLAGQTYVTRYRYQAGRLTGLTSPTGKRIDYTLDGLGRIAGIAVTDNGTVRTVVSQVQYHPFGGIKSYLTGAGQTVSRVQDLDGRLTAYTLGGALWQLGYDAAARIVYQTDAGNAANTAGYGYDSLDRLTSAALPATTLGYGYDASGNRTQQSIGGATYAYQIDPASNRLAGIASTPPRTYAHDAAGNRTGDGAVQSAYDARGRLVQVTTAAGTTRYRVDADGRRVRKTQGTEDTVFHYDRDGRLIAETSAAGQARRDYLWLNELPVGVLQ